MANAKMISVMAHEDRKMQAQFDERLTDAAARTLEIVEDEIDALTERVDRMRDELDELGAKLKEMRDAAALSRSATASRSTSGD